MISIVNYGLGNVHAILNIYKRLNIDVAIVSSPDELTSGEKIILPGVGAFDGAMKRLNESGLRDILDEMVIGESKPVLGICVGMQLMASKSEEGTSKGLGWIDGEVKKFEASDGKRKVYLPHMGWNNVQPCRNDSLFKDLDSEARFYFLHSYYFVPHIEDDVLAVTEYNGLFPSSVNSNNIFGVQFHPEKSHQWGIKLLKNFAEL